MCKLTRIPSSEGQQGEQGEQFEDNDRVGHKISANIEKKNQKEGMVYFLLPLGGHF
jgi:hypothetical protein